VQVSEAPVTLTRDGSVAILTLNRPAVGNAIDNSLTSALAQAVRAVSDDVSVRCVLLTASGRLFCAGGDIAAMSTAAADVPSYLRALADDLHASVLKLSAMPKPLAVLVNGPAAGAGLSLALLGDIVLAARSAHFIAAYGTVGLSPDGGMSWLLPRVVGLRRAQEIILTNRKVSAAEAAQLGLVTEAVADEDLMTRGLDLARRLASGPTRALGLARSLLRETFDAPLAEHLEKEASRLAAAAASRDCREGVNAFLERRPPCFTGED
jgi:2-(1,2-epoxy-1,2-dihydrophenyl)acetyl-CoA isomerase